MKRILVWLLLSALMIAIFGLTGLIPSLFCYWLSGKIVGDETKENTNIAKEPTIEDRYEVLRDKLRELEIPKSDYFDEKMKNNEDLDEKEKDQYELRKSLLELFDSRKDKTDFDELYPKMVSKIDTYSKKYLGKGYFIENRDSEQPKIEQDTSEQEQLLATSKTKYIAPTNKENLSENISIPEKYSLEALNMAIKNKGKNGPNALYGLEFVAIPEAFFNSTRSFIEGLENNNSSLYNLYSLSCKGLSLRLKYNINDFKTEFYDNGNDEKVIKLYFPTPEKVPQCYYAYLVFNSEYKPLHYYTVEKEYYPGKDVATLCEVGPNNYRANLGKTMTIGGDFGVLRFENTVVSEEETNLNNNQDDTNEDATITLAVEKTEEKQNEPVNDEKVIDVEVNVVKTEDISEIDNPIASEDEDDNKGETTENDKENKDKASIDEPKKILFCRFCGNKLGGDFVYCNKCGKKIQ